MQELKIPEKVKNNIQNFIQGLKNLYGQDLLSVILYGSAASGEFVAWHSNLNILVILNNTDLDFLKRAIGLIRKFSMLNPLFLTQDYIRSSTDIFPIEFLDIRENYYLLYGEDVIKDISVDIKNLRFQCEQELKAKLISLRQAYLRLNRDKLSLRYLLFKSFNSILHILRNVLRLKGKKPTYLKEDILKEIALEFRIDVNLWEKLLAAKNKQIKISNKDIEDIFIKFVREIEKIVDIVDRL